MGILLVLAHLHASRARLVLTALLPLADIASFFSNLYTDLMLFALAFSVFCLARGGILYMASGITANERQKVAAINALYAALGGLAIAGLAWNIAGQVNSAATSSPAGPGK